MVDAQEIERRISTRIGGCEDVELESEGRLIGCPIKDISISGARICIGADEGVHYEESVTLWVEDWEPIEARVVWMTACESGLEFTSARAHAA
jgi:hypothetical protein